MNQIIPYQFEGYDIRTTQRGGETWWVLVDVCRALELTNSRMVSAALDADEKADVSLPYVSSNDVTQRRTVTIVNIAGLNRLIFRSDKPVAKRLQRWVFHDVLPAIFKKGSYSLRGDENAAAAQAFMERVGMPDRVPAGYWCIFRELHPFFSYLIQAGANIGATFLPDISVGRCWSDHWNSNDLESQYGARLKFEQNFPERFPQSKANPHYPYCYPDAAWPEYKRWLREVYAIGNLPKYLRQKEKEGDISPEASQFIIGAAMKRLLKTNMK